METKKANKVLEGMKKSECTWPGCNKTMELTIPLPSLLPGKVEGSFNAEPKSSVICAFCLYHAFIAGSGHFGVVKSEDNKIMLHGAFPMVGLIESVMAARETTKLVQPKTKEEVAEFKKKNDKKEKV